MPEELERAVRARPNDVRAAGLRRWTTGPVHDPHSAVIYWVTMEDFSIIQLEESWLGTRLIINGIDIPRGDVIDDSKWDQLVEFWFEGLTGIRPFDIDGWEEEDWERRSDILATEREAGWDPSP